MMYRGGSRILKGGFLVSGGAKGSDVSTVEGSAGPLQRL